MQNAKSEDSPEYGSEDTIQKALQILAARLRKPGIVLTSPQSVKDYLTLKLATLEHEEFGVLFLDAQHQVIGEVEMMFRGTLTQTSVYPREVIKRALQLNAAAVILTHNHPSGNANPSRADEQLTATLQKALAMVDVRILDHTIIGGMETVSFAERGML